MNTEMMRRDKIDQGHYREEEKEAVKIQSWETLADVETRKMD